MKPQIKCNTKNKTLFLSLSLIALIALGFAWHNNKPVQHRITALTQHISLPHFQSPPPANPPLPWTTQLIGKHGSLTTACLNAGVSQSTLHTITQLPLVERHLTLLKPGQPLHFQMDHTTLVTLKVPLSLTKTLWVESNHHHYTARLEKASLDTTLEYSSGTIHHTLGTAAKAAGLNNLMTAKLTHIFSGKINFSRDIHPGDQFRVLHRAYYFEGKKVSDGTIVAAEFITKGHPYRAIEYTDPQGHSSYYDENGHSLERLFLRAPLHYNRISSYFSYSRMDPVLHKMRPHLGVDFAAPRGTPIHSVSDGTIATIGKKGGYGNAIVARYGPHIHMLYGHMAQFAHHLHPGSHIDKGQIIGYVGSTGWSTGPHLHYGVYISGKPQNPLTVKLPFGNGIVSRNKHSFENHAQTLLAELDLHAGPALAKAIK